MSGRTMYLLIPEPENCDECRIRHMGLAWCQTGGFSTSHFPGGKPVNGKKRHPDCPLRPVPGRMTTDGKDPQQRAAGYAYGWNDCLDALESRAGLPEIERHFAERNINADLTDQEEMV